jgi:nucleoside-diphosphate-sugar epimerase
MKRGAIFIYASTKDVYGNHAEGLEFVDETVSTDYSGQTGFEWSKLIGERYVEYYAHARNLRACIFRLSTIFARLSDDNAPGIVTHYVESVKHRVPIRLPDNVDPVRDILYVDDFSRACRAFINSRVQFGLYNLGGGRLNAISLRDLLQKIGTIIDIEPVIQNDPAMPTPVPLRYVSDTRHIEKELDWRPQISIEHGIGAIL